MSCQGTDGERLDRPYTPGAEVDITMVDLATYARQGYNAQRSITYISSSLAQSEAPVPIALVKS